LGDVPEYFYLVDRGPRAAHRGGFGSLGGCDRRGARSSPSYKGYSRIESEFTTPSSYPLFAIYTSPISPSTVREVSEWGLSKPLRQVIAPACRMRAQQMRESSNKPDSSQ